MKIVLCSKSDVKLRAVKKACPDADVNCVASQSKVNWQPSSELETLHGALHRMCDAFPNPGELVVSVENGLRQEGSRWFDLAYVVVRDPSGTLTIRRSAQVEVPQELVDQSRAHGWRVTCGDLEARRSRDVRHDDPHVKWGGCSRVDILAETIKEAVGVAQDGYLKRIPDEVEVSFRGAASARLPVREVAPGVSVALLELYRDPDLTEAVAQALALLVPGNCDYVLSPEGKAQCLLHAFAIRTGMIPILVRKSKKSYMLEPVVSTYCKSVTSGETHSFYLGADDAERLRGKNVVLLDDVMSGGGTMGALQELTVQCGVASVTVAVAATEGKKREDVVSLAHLEVYK